MKLCARIVTVAALAVIPAIAGAQDKARIKFVHAAPDVPVVNVLGNEKKIFSDISYQNAGDFTEVEAAETVLEVNNADSGDTLIEGVKLKLEAGKSYVVVALAEQTTGTEEGAEPRARAEVLSFDTPKLGEEKTAVAFFHAVSDAPTVNVLLNGEPAFKNVSYGKGAVPATVASGQQKVNIKAGNKSIAGPDYVSGEAGRLYLVVAAGTAEEDDDHSLNVQIYEDTLVEVKAADE